MSPRVGSILLAGVLVLTACSPTSSDATPTTQRSTTTTAGPSRACSNEPHTPLDSDALAVESINGDVDGDGFDDTVTGYLLGESDPAEATAAVLHVELASAWGTELRVDELGLGDGPAMAEPRTVVTMGDERIVVAGVAGISTGQLFAFFIFEDCMLSVVDTEDGVVPDIWVGGGRTHDDWFVCESDRVLMVQFGTSNPDADPKVYGAGAAQTYEYVEGSFHQIRSSDIDAALPATFEEVASVYPPCVG